MHLFPQQMQSEFEGLQLETKRKEASLDLVSTEKEKLMNRLKSEEDSHLREKRLLLEEIVQLKKEKELMEKDNSRKDNQILQARDELDKSAAAIRSAETKIQMLRNQVHVLSPKVLFPQMELPLFQAYSRGL